MSVQSVESQPEIKPNVQDYHVLIVEDFKGKRSIPLSYATYSLGRDKTNTIQIEDPAVSRHHAILIRVPLPNRQYFYRIVDGDAKGRPSRNGIKINGVKHRKKDLQSGDTIYIGEVAQISYLVQSLTEEEFNWHFQRQDLTYRSIQEDALDPTGTLVTILAH